MYDDEISIILTYNIIYNIMIYISFTEQCIEPHCEYEDALDLIIHILDGIRYVISSRN
jgi:hypothetical protein